MKHNIQTRLTQKDVWVNSVYDLYYNKKHNWDIRSFILAKTFLKSLNIDIGSPINDTNVYSFHLDSTYLTQGVAIQFYTNYDWKIRWRVKCIVHFYPDGIEVRDREYEWKRFPSVKETIQFIEENR